MTEFQEDTEGLTGDDDWKLEAGVHQDSVREETKNLEYVTKIQESTWGRSAPVL